MKAVTPVQLPLHCVSKQSLNIARCRMDEEDLFCLQYDMNDCYSRLKRLVPTIPQDKKVSKVEILQHVIDYILDLQLALETHPSLHKQQQQQHRTPLTVLNTDHHQVRPPSSLSLSSRGDSYPGFIMGEMWSGDSPSAASFLSFAQVSRPRFFYFIFISLFT
uniref:DNA-binding protein inhibitor ID-4 n=1 Tax=Scophthalmus maximus TaxID=52904 RepID=A0A8D3DFR8_SCOMX